MAKLKDWQICPRYRGQMPGSRARMAGRRRLAASAAPMRRCSDHLRVSSESASRASDSITEPAAHTRPNTSEPPCRWVTMSDR